jgi:hypothetical protein
MKFPEKGLGTMAAKWPSTERVKLGIVVQNKTPNFMLFPWSTPVYKTTPTITSHHCCQVYSSQIQKITQNICFGFVENTQESLQNMQYCLRQNMYNLIFHNFFEERMIIEKLIF